MLTMGLIVFVLLMTQPDGHRSQMVSTVGLAVDAPATLQLERDAQAHELAMARVEAERAKVIAEQRTLRLLAVVAGVTAMGLCVAAWQGFATRPRVVYVNRLPDRAQGFESLPYLQLDDTQRSREP